MIRINTKSIGVIQPFRITMNLKSNKRSMVNTKSNRMHAVEMLFHRFNGPTTSFQSYQLNKLLTASYSFHFLQYFKTSLIKKHIKQNHISQSHVKKNNMKSIHDYYSPKYFQNMGQSVFSSVFNNIKKIQTSTKVYQTQDISKTGLYRNITNVKKMMYKTVLNTYPNKTVSGKLSNKIRNHHDLVFISRQEKIKNSNNVLRKILPVEIVYRQSTQRKDVPIVQTKQPVLDNSMPKLDISRLSNEVIRRINKQVRIERERQGRF